MRRQLEPSAVYAILLVITAQLIILFQTVTAESCDVVQTRCVGNVECRQSLLRYLADCGDVLVGEVASCRHRCRESVAALHSVPNHDGQLFLACDCGAGTSLDGLCHTQRRRLRNACERDSELDNDDDDLSDDVDDGGGRTSCQEAELNCLADESCLDIIERSQRLCARLVSSRRRCMSPRCNTTLYELRRHVAATRLQSCSCSRAEQYSVSCFVSTTQHRHLPSCHRGGAANHLHSTMLPPIRHQKQLAQRRHRHARRNFVMRETVASNMSLKLRTPCSRKTCRSLINESDLITHTAANESTPSDITEVQNKLTDLHRISDTLTDILDSEAVGRANSVWPGTTPTGFTSSPVHVPAQLNASLQVDVPSEMSPGHTAESLTLQADIQVDNPVLPREFFWTNDIDESSRPTLLPDEADQVYIGLDLGQPYVTISAAPSLGIVSSWRTRLVSNLVVGALVLLILL